MKEEVVLETESKIKKLFKIFLFLFLFLVLSFYLYIHYIEPKIIKINEEAVVDYSLPDAFNGFKIIHFSDIHYGSTINDKEINTIVKKINDLNPDVIVYTGDLLDDAINIKEESLDKVKEILKTLKAKLKKYAVIGNADYVNKEKYVEIMQEAGFIILENANDFLYYKGNSPIEFIGTSSLLEGENDIDKAIISEVDNADFKVWLNHEPTIFDTLLEKDLHPNLLLTGHALGGMINIPFYGYLLKQEGISKYTDNYYHKKKINMYISNGLGTYKYNVRFMNRPSINFYRLYNH